MSSTFGSKDDGGVIHSMRSWPDFAENSPAVLGGRSAWLMWSTVTVIFFFWAQSLTQPSNQVSYLGTKWLHSRMLKPFLLPPPPAVHEVSNAGPTPRAAAATPLALMKSRRLRARISYRGWGSSFSLIGTPDWNGTCSGLRLRTPRLQQTLR